MRYREDGRTIDQKIAEAEQRLDQRRSELQKAYHEYYERVARRRTWRGYRFKHVRIERALKAFFCLAVLVLLSPAIYAIYRSLVASF